MMKKSSMHTAPKGRMPPKAMEKRGCVYHICSGICLQQQGDHTQHTPVIRDRGVEISGLALAVSSLLPSTCLMVPLCKIPVSIYLAIWLVRTGTVMASFLNPK